MDDKGIGSVCNCRVITITDPSTFRPLQNATNITLYSTYEDSGLSNALNFCALHGGKKKKKKKKCNYLEYEYAYELL